MVNITFFEYINIYVKRIEDLTIWLYVYRMHQKLCFLESKVLYKNILFHISDLHKELFPSLFLS